MKRLIVCFLAFSMLISLTLGACAEVEFVTVNENFTIRNGIRFGLTKEEIKNIEETNVSTPYESSTFYGDNGYDLSYSTLLAGYEGMITYWIDDNNVLDEFQYLLYTSEAYSNVKAALTKKYGNPLFDEQSYIFGTGIDKLSKNLDFLSSIERDYAGWIVKYNDCYLMLETKHLYFTEGSGMSAYLVNYDILSYEEMVTYQAAYDGIIEYMNSSFENDL